MPIHHQPTVIPCLRYVDAVRAIDWLGESFGLVCHLKIEDESGGIVHCQMKMPNGGMLMLGSAGGDSSYAEQVVAPSAVGNKNTQTIYVVVDDVRAHYEQAVSAGVKIMTVLEARSYGGQGYECYDLEGHIWSFGDYDPFA